MDSISNLLSRLFPQDYTDDRSSWRQIVPTHWTPLSFVLVGLIVKSSFPARTIDGRNEPCIPPLPVKCHSPQKSTSIRSFSDLMRRVGQSLLPSCRMQDFWPLERA